VPTRCGYACAVYWILAAIFILIALSQPRLRPFGVVGCVVLGAMLAWGIGKLLRSEDPSQAPIGQQRGKSASPAAELQAVPLKMVAAENLHLSGGGAPFELGAHMAKNSSDTPLPALTIRLTRRDCYEGAVDPSGCVTLWQDDHWIAVSGPAGQVPRTVAARPRRSETSA